MQTCKSSSQAKLEIADLEHCNRRQSKICCGRSDGKNRIKAQGSRTVDHQHRELLQQMALLCASVQGLGKQMQDGIANEGRGRQEDNKKLKDEMYAGFRNEEKARKPAQNDLAVMKEVIQKLKKGSGSTVCSEANTRVGLGASGTFAEPPGVASRRNEVLILAKMELKCWITDCTRSSFQEITNEEVTESISPQKLTGINRGRSKGTSQPKQVSTCGSRMKRIWLR